MYDVADQVLLRKFQITLNLSLDGVLDVLNSKNMTDAGPLNLIDDDNSDVDDGVDKQTRVNSSYDLPGSMQNRGRPIARTKCLRIAPTGRSWAAATTEGAIEAALGENQPSRALILSLRLNEDNLIKKCIVAVAPVDIKAVVASIPFKYLNRLIQTFAELLENCPHLEFILRWCQVLL
uniref:Putative small-subunit processome, Utp12, Periodic tryptophan protein 2 n=1 Tax=Helianthus annuus TaxID=4232 RepID=A0A251UWS0_HELAN